MGSLWPRIEETSGSDVFVSANSDSAAAPAEAGRGRLPEDWN